MLESVKELLKNIGVTDERSNDILVQILETIAKNLNADEQKKLDTMLGNTELSEDDLSSVGGGRAFNSTRAYIENKCSKLATKISHGLSKLRKKLDHGLDRLSDDFEDLGENSHGKTINFSDRRR